MYFTRNEGVSYTLFKLVNTKSYIPKMTSIYTNSIFTCVFPLLIDTSNGTLPTPERIRALHQSNPETIVRFDTNTTGFYCHFEWTPTGRLRVYVGFSAGVPRNGRVASVYESEVESFGGVAMGESVSFSFSCIYSPFRSLSSTADLLIIFFAAEGAAQELQEPASRHHRRTSARSSGD